jgi:hypothetical protein
MVFKMTGYANSKMKQGATLPECVQLQCTASQYQDRFKESMKKRIHLRGRIAAAPRPFGILRHFVNSEDGDDNPDHPGAS